MTGVRGDRTMSVSTYANDFRGLFPVTTEPETPRHDPWAAMRQPNFAWTVIGRVGGATAMRLMDAAIFWQVYEISGSAFQLAMVGVARFLPSLGLGLVGGAVADAFDKRRIAVISQFIMLLWGVVLLVVAATDNAALGWLYLAAFGGSVAAAFDNPARQALLPQLVTRETFPNAITVSSTAQQLGFVTGPALAGFLIWIGGISLAYGVYGALVGLSILTFVPLRLLPIEAPKRAVSLSAIAEGVRFVWHRQVILGAMALDMFAVIFGGATALLPIYAADILDVGSLGYGLLAGSLDAGALFTSAVLIARPQVVRPGRALLWAVFAFGVGTIVFGFSRNFALSLAAYALIGVADQVSVVMRQTTIQLATPDELRGRVTSVNMLFIGTSNQLGTVESGFVAALTTATFAVVSGGIGCLAVLGIVAAKMPELRRYRIDTPMESASLPVTPPGPTPAGEAAGGSG